MGLQKVHSFSSRSENIDQDVYKIGKGLLGTIDLDCMEPLDETKSPKVHNKALHHIGLWVDDLHNAVEYLNSVDVKTLGKIRKNSGLYDNAFLDPKSAGGVLIELIQAPEEVINEYNQKN